MFKYVDKCIFHSQYNYFIKYHECTQDAVVRVMGRESRDKRKFDLAFTYCKNKLTDFRTEERRKVIAYYLK